MPTRTGTKPSSYTWPAATTGTDWIDNIIAFWGDVQASTIIDMSGNEAVMNLEAGASQSAVGGLRGNCLASNDAGGALASVLPSKVSAGTLTDYSIVVCLQLGDDINSSGTDETVWAMVDTGGGDDANLMLWTTNEAFRGRAEGPGQNGPNIDASERTVNISGQWVTLAFVVDATNDMVYQFQCIDGLASTANSAVSTQTTAFAANLLGFLTGDTPAYMNAVGEFFFITETVLTQSQFDTIATDPYSWAAADATAPTLSSATIPTAGTSISLLFDETVNIGAGGNGGVTLSMSGGAVTAAYASGGGSDTLVYNLSRTILDTETGTISYTQPGDGIEDVAGNDLGTFAGAAVTNNSTQTLTRSIDSVTSDFYPGASGIEVATSNFGTITTATLAGEALTVSGQVGNTVTLAVPAGVQLKLGVSTYQLFLSDGTGSATLDNQTLAVTPGYELVNYDGNDPDPTLESLHKASLNDPEIGNIEADVDDQWEVQAVADVTYDSSSQVFVVPPATKSAIPYRLWDNSLGQWSAFSTVTWAAQPTLTSPGLTSTGQTTMDLSVTTDVDTGTLYWYISTSATPPSATDLKAGTGSAAFGNIAISTAGAKTDSAISLSAGTTYYLHALHTNTVDSEVVTSSGVATDAAGDPTPDAITFTDVTDAAVSTQYQDVQPITGVDAGQTLNVTNGELSNDNQASWTTSPIPMVTGQSFVRATLTSSANRSTAVNVAVTVNTVSDTFTVTTFANSDPVFSGTVPNQSGPRNVASLALDLSSYFSDANGDTLSYSLQAGTLPTGLSLSSDTGIISGTPTVLGTATGLVVRASDGFGGTADTNAFSWEVTNTQPGISGQAFNVADGAGEGTVIGTVSASDANDDTLSYSITAGNNGDLAINASTGQLTVAAGRTLDAGTTDFYSLTVEIDDQTGAPNATNTATITVSVAIPLPGRRKRGFIGGMGRMMR